MNPPLSSHRPRVNTSAAASLTAWLFAAAASAQTPTITNLGVLPGMTDSTSTAISADGTTVVGRSGSSWSNRRAFRWTTATGMQDIGALPGHIFATATAVNADGTVVVGSSSSGFGSTPAFRWTAAAGMQEIGILPGDDSAVATGISYDGATVVGWCDDGGGGIGHRPFRWTAATGMQPLPIQSVPTYASAISSDGSAIAGSFGGLMGNDHWGVRWSAAGVETFPLLAISSISADGVYMAGTWSWCEICGVCKGGCTWVAKRWAGSEWESLFLGSAHAISGDGRVVAGYGYFGPPGSSGAAIWSRETGAVYLHQHLATLGLNLDGWRLEVVTGLSHDGRGIVGTGTFNGSPRAWLVSMPPSWPGCYANCDQSTTAPILNVADFACFLQRFAAGDPYANCDDSGTPPVLTVADFTCYLTHFAAGCP